MKRFIIRLVINAVALYLAVFFVPGLSLNGDWGSLLWLALIFGIINDYLHQRLRSTFILCGL